MYMSCFFIFPKKRAYCCCKNRWTCAHCSTIFLMRVRVALWSVLTARLLQYHYDEATASKKPEGAKPCSIDSAYKARHVHAYLFCHQLVNHACALMMQRLVIDSSSFLRWPAAQKLDVSCVCQHECKPSMIFSNVWRRDFFAPNAFFRPSQTAIFCKLTFSSQPLQTGAVAWRSWASLSVCTGLVQ